MQELVGHRSPWRGGPEYLAMHGVGSINLSAMAWVDPFTPSSAFMAFHTALEFRMRNTGGTQAPDHRRSWILARPRAEGNWRRELCARAGGR